MFMVSLRALIEIYKIARQFFEYPFVTLLLALLGVTTVITYRQQIAGFAVTVGKKLHYFAINKKFQGRGLGKKLFAKASVDVRKLCVATKNDIAISLYKKNGFKITRQIRTLVGRRYVMER